MIFNILLFVGLLNNYYYWPLLMGPTLTGVDPLSGQLGHGGDVYKYYMLRARQWFPFYHHSLLTFSYVNVFLVW